MRLRAAAQSLALAALLAPHPAWAQRERAVLTADEVVYDRRAGTVSAFGNAVVRYGGIEVRSQRLAHDLTADTVLSDTWTVVATSGVPPTILTAKWVFFDRGQGSVVARGSATLTHGDAVLNAEEIAYDTVRELAIAHGRPVLTSSGAILTADLMRYDRTAGTVDATGNVTGTWEGFELRAPAARYDARQREMVVSSGAEVRRSGGVVAVESARVRVDETVLDAERFAGYFAPYYGRSARARISSDRYELRDTVVTHCDRDHPHYWFSARRVVVVPGDHLTMYNVALNVGGIPVLWLPLYRVPLEHREDCFIIEPGHDSAHGFFARTRYLFPAAGGRMKVLWDLYERQGVGGGLEYTYAGTAASGSLYGYSRYEPQIPPRVRWNVLAQENRAVGKTWSLRTAVELISDEQVYQDYFAENWFRVRRNVRSEIMLSKTARTWSLRFGGVREETFTDAMAAGAVSWRAPAVLTLYPQAAGPFSIANTCSVEPQVAPGVSTMTLAAINEFRCELPLARGVFSCAPRLTMRSEYRGGIVDGSTGQLYQWYTGGLPVRIRFPRGVLEVLYTETRRSRADSFDLEQGTGAVMGRMLAPRLDVAAGGFTARVGWSVDLRDSETPWMDRFSPLSLEAQMTGRGAEAGGQLEVQPLTGRVLNAQCTTGVAGSLGRLVLGYGYAAGAPEPHGMSVSCELRALPATTVRTDATASSDGHRVIFSRWSWDVIRDLHCWEARVRLSSRRDASGTDARDILELWGYAGLKFDAPVLGRDASAAERQTFPWRYE